MTSEPSLPLEHLLAQSDWVTQLARVLVRDPATADDIAQAAWVDVLRAPPRPSVPLRGWLAAIVRRKALRVARTTARRARREQVAALASAGQTAPSAAEVAARMATHRELLDAVLALEEPYRETVVLRFFENLDLAAISERTQSKLNTVRSRLQRGLQCLRDRLDRSPGGRERWLPAVLLLSRRQLTTEAAVGAGGMAAGIALAITMKKILITAAAVTAAVLCTVPWLLPEAPGPLPTVGVDAAPPAAAALPTRPTAAPSSVAGEAVRVATPMAAVSDRPGRRLVDREGRPLASVTVRAESPHAVRWQGGDRGWISGAERSLRILPAEEEKLLADPAYAQQYFAGFAHADEWRATVLGTALPAREVISDAAGAFEFASELAVSDAAITIGDPAFVLVAAGVTGKQPWIASPATRVTGRVRNAEGKPLADTFALPLCALPDAVELAHQLEVRTDDDGGFLVRQAAANGLLRVGREGYETAFVPLGEAPQQHLEIVLRQRVATATSQLDGLVVDVDGRPIAEATVWFGRQRTTTGADGRFAVPLDNPQPQYALTIVAKGYALFQQDGLGAALAEAQQPTRDLLFVLRAKPLVARGLVLGSDGAPLAGALVGLLDPTLLDISFEGVEARVGGWSAGVATGPDGTFSLAGLGERAYRFRAVDPATGALTTSAPHRADAGDLVLRLPHDLRRAVRGTVQIDGQAAAGASVEISYCTHITKGGGTQFDSALAVSCDGDGRFVLPVLPRRTAWLGVRIEGGLRHMVPVECLPDGNDVLIAVDNQRWLQLVGSAFPEVRPIHFELADGRVVASGATLATDGDAPPLSIPATAVAVLLDHGGPHAARQPLTDDRAVLLRVR